MAGRDWRDRAACRDVDPDLFFPVGGSGPAQEQIERAKAVCGECSVVADCLAFAMLALPDGVAGGMTPAERARVREAFGLDGPYFLFAGNDKPHKNLDGLLAGFSRFSAASADHTLVVAGGAPSRAGERAASAARHGVGARVKDVGIVADRDLVPVEMFGGAEFPKIGELPYLLTLSPHTFYWFSLQQQPEEVTVADFPAGPAIPRVPDLGVRRDPASLDPSLRPRGIWIPSQFRCPWWVGAPGPKTWPSRLIRAEARDGRHEPGTGARAPTSAGVPRRSRCCARSKRTAPGSIAGSPMPPPRHSAPNARAPNRVSRSGRHIAGTGRARPRPRPATTCGSRSWRGPSCPGNGAAIRPSARGPSRHMRPCPTS